MFMNEQIKCHTLEKGTCTESAFEVLAHINTMTRTRIKGAFPNWPSAILLLIFKLHTYFLFQKVFFDVMYSTPNFTPISICIIYV